MSSKIKLVKFRNNRQVLIRHEDHGLFLVSESKWGDETLVFRSNEDAEIIDCNEVDGASGDKLCDFLNWMLFEAVDWQPRPSFQDDDDE